MVVKDELQKYHCMLGIPSRNTNVEKIELENRKDRKVDC
jgi:hypothetical protein